MFALEAAAKAQARHDAMKSELAAMRTAVSRSQEEVATAMGAIQADMTAKQNSWNEERRALLMQLATAQSVAASSSISAATTASRTRTRGTLRRSAAGRAFASSPTRPSSRGSPTRGGARA